MSGAVQTGRTGKTRWIGPAVVTGAVVYIVIAVWQAILHPAVIPEAVAIAVLLAVFASGLVMKNPNAMKKGEMAAVWICILLFAAYGILRIGGIL
ncbi:hypothetical protein [Methanolacinia petrolearia]|uniref:hypothetical protein n=1 Tax=Methanolacinia petrolearia TaxID=54120 RepID=UPI003BAAC9F2